MLLLPPPPPLSCWMCRAHTREERLQQREEVGRERGLWYYCTRSGCAVVEYRVGVGSDVWWTRPAAKYMYPGVSLEGSDPGGVRSGWGKGARWEQGAKNLGVLVLTNEPSRRNSSFWPDIIFFGNAIYTIGGVSIVSTTDGVYKRLYAPPALVHRTHLGRSREQLEYVGMGWGYHGSYRGAETVQYSKSCGPL